MIELIKDQVKWNTLVKTFPDWDVYYLYEYSKALQIHGDGEPTLLYYKSNDCELCYVILEKDISESVLFQGDIEKGKYYDWETPYGYGGPLFRKKTMQGIQRFAEEIRIFCEEKNVVSQFLRFHPLVLCPNMMPKDWEMRYLKDTIVIDTKCEEDILKNMNRSCRYKIRKALREGIYVERKSIHEYKDFINLYYETMKRDKAQEYYYFKEDYFKALEELRENASIFFTVKEGEIMSSAIMLHNERFMHYHLGGTFDEYLKYSPNNLLFYEAAIWANHQGIECLHLGGGLQAGDKLYQFKRQFNGEGDCPYYVGRTVFRRDSYEKLCDIREKKDAGFDRNNSFLIQYRR